MALARNIHRKKSKFRLPKIKKKSLLIFVPLFIVVLIFAGFNLFKIIPDSKKIEIKYETGDRPLPQVIPLWVTADGGLYMREEAVPKGKILILIPDGTKLEATETKEDWYKVTYMEKTGWVNKNYVTTTAPAEEPTKTWNTYTDKNYSYSVRYPKDWVYVDYGENPATASKSYLAFGQQLPPQLDPINLPPIILRISTENSQKINSDYAGRGGTTETVTVSSLAANKYTFNSSSGIQMTTYVVTRGTNTFIIEETGGYADDLSRLVGTLNL